MSLINSITRRWAARRIAKRLAADEEGSILTELALSMPIYIGLLTGVVEVGNYLLLNLKVQHTVVTIADLVTRDEAITEAVITDIFQVIPHIMAPYSTGVDTVTIITSISQTEDEQATIFWQRSGGGTLNEGSEFGLEGEVANLTNIITMRDNETVLATEVYYRYEPLIFNFLPSQTIRRVSYFRPRIGSLQEIS
ncbi:MAG: pilus assembly protein [Kordiimonadaceae bacterium]|nr:pilus assembly protein [Kordiimonadaceae bacterium]